MQRQFPIFLLCNQFHLHCYMLVFLRLEEEKAPFLLTSLFHTSVVLFLHQAPCKICLYSLSLILLQFFGKSPNYFLTIPFYPLLKQLFLRLTMASTLLKSTGQFPDLPVLPRWFFLIVYNFSVSFANAIFFFFSSILMLHSAGMPQS